MSAGGAKHFVTQETVRQILDACPDAERRLILALCRFGGVRCPSELLPLCWSEVNWEQGRFLVHSPKTEHHEGGADGCVPSFPSCAPTLKTPSNAPSGGASSSSTDTATRTRICERCSCGSSAGLRTLLMRIIRRAGVAPWPTLFQNLRASRETELAAVYPLHVVCARIGSSTLIAQKHYVEVTERDYEKATWGDGEGGAKSGAVSG